MDNIQLFENKSDYIQFLKNETMAKLMESIKKHLNEDVIIKEYNDDYYAYTSSYEIPSYQSDGESYSCIEYALLQENYKLVGEFIDMGFKYEKNDILKTENKELINKVFGNITEYNLFTIAEENLVKLLDILDKKFVCDNINNKNKSGETPLMVACYKREIELAKKMIETYGADPKIVNNNGNDCLHYYMNTLHNKFYIEDMEYLIQKGTNPNNESTRVLILKQMRSGEVDRFIKLLINYHISFSINNIYDFADIFKSLDGSYYSAKYKYCVELFIENSIELNTVFNLLCYYYPEINCVYSIGRDSWQLYQSYLQQILKKGYKINSLDKSGKTALFHCRNKHIVEWLLINGIDKAIQDNNGDTALEYYKKKETSSNIYAQLNEKNKYEIIKALDVQLEPNEINIKVYNATKEQIEKILKENGFVMN